MNSGRVDKRLVDMIGWDDPAQFCCTASKVRLKPLPVTGVGVESFLHLLVEARKIWSFGVRFQLGLTFTARSNRILRDDRT